MQHHLKACKYYFNHGDDYNRIVFVYRLTGHCYHIVSYKYMYWNGTYRLSKWFYTNKSYLHYYIHNHDWNGIDFVNDFQATKVTLFFYSCHRDWNLYVCTGRPLCHRSNNRPIWTRRNLLLRLPSKNGRSLAFENWRSLCKTFKPFRLSTRYAIILLFDIIKLSMRKMRKRWSSLACDAITIRGSCARAF